jgi:hypothetical protein
MAPQYSSTAGSDRSNATQPAGDIRQVHSTTSPITILRVCHLVSGQVAVISDGMLTHFLQFQSCIVPPQPSDHSQRADMHHAAGLYTKLVLVLL